MARVSKPIIASLRHRMASRQWPIFPNRSSMSNPSALLRCKVAESLKLCVIDSFWSLETDRNAGYEGKRGRANVSGKASISATNAKPPPTPPKPTQKQMKRVCTHTHVFFLTGGAPQVQVFKERLEKSEGMAPGCWVSSLICGAVVLEDLCMRKKLLVTQHVYCRNRHPKIESKAQSPS